MSYKIGSSEVINNNSVWTGRTVNGSAFSTNYTFGPTATLTSQSATSPGRPQYDICVLTSSLVLNARRSSTTAVIVNALSIDSSDVVTFGTNFSVSVNAEPNSICLVRLTDTTALLLIATATATSTLTARILTVSGTTITEGTPVTVATSGSSTRNINNVVIEQIGSQANPTRFLVCYSSADASSNPILRSIFIGISGSTITVGTEFTVATGNSPNISYQIAMAEFSANTTANVFSIAHTEANNISATYSVDASGACTITATGHGILDININQGVYYLNFIDGASETGLRTLYYSNANTLTCNLASTSTSGNVSIWNNTVRIRRIQESANVITGIGVNFLSKIVTNGAADSMILINANDTTREVIGTTSPLYARTHLLFFKKNIFGTANVANTLYSGTVDTLAVTPISLTTTTFDFSTDFYEETIIPGYFVRNGFSLRKLANNRNILIGTTAGPSSAAGLLALSYNTSDAAGYKFYNYTYEINDLIYNSTIRIGSSYFNTNVFNPASKILLNTSYQTILDRTHNKIVGIMIDETRMLFYYVVGNTTHNARVVRFTQS